MAKVFQNKTILSILDKYRDLWALGYTSAVIGWDLETYMPPLGASMRGEALGRLSTIRQKLFLDKSFVSLIHQAEKQKGLTDTERGIVRLLLHNLKFYEKLPPKFLEDFSLLTSQASIIWREAKEKEDYKKFESSLSKIFEMNRKMADYLGYKNSPYDALLDLFEEGLSISRVEPFFDEIRSPLKNLLTKIVSSPKYFKSHPLEFAKYNKEKMVKLNDKVLKFLWQDYGQNLRLDTSAHPFTIGFSNTDTRITTWYHDTDFARSLLSVIHEFGHALYELQCDPKLQMTPIQGGSSLVIHESQSRFWENFVGLSSAFIQKFLPDIREVVNNPKLTVKEVYSYFNKVRPGFLRVEADEVTYHFHIMLRFEIEKGLIEGSLKIKDVREIWNTKMKDYLGITPNLDSEGVLQDIHWSMGNVGYFPTYSLGTFLGAQWENKISDGEFNMTNLKNTKEWLQKNIHRYGSTYTLEDLLRKNNMKFDSKVNLDYLQKKYSKIYEF